MLDLGGVIHLGGVYLLYLDFLCVIHYYAFMCLLSCIELYLCDSDIYVIVIFM